MTISENDIEELVERFYASIRADDVLGPIFNAHVADWPAHLEKLCAFWLTVATGTPAYKGTPMQAHMQFTHLGDDHFARWLAIFHQTTAALFDAEKAAHFDTRADRIAESLKLGIQFRRGALT